MKELKINVPDGYEVDKEKSTFENIVFKKKKELPTRWSEKYNDGYTHSYGLYYTEIGTEFRYKTLGQARASVALAKLSQLRDVYRQGWKPDWNDMDTEKWVVNIRHSDIRVSCFYSTNTFLSFQDEQTAILFRDNFRELIEEAKPLMS